MGLQPTEKRDQAPNEPETLAGLLSGCGENQPQVRTQNVSLNNLIANPAPCRNRSAEAVVPRLNQDSF